MTHSRVIGLDLALTSTGLADATTADRTSLRTITTTTQGDTLADIRARLGGIVDDIADAVHRRGGHPTLILIEGPSYGSSGAGTWDRAGLWWLTVDRLMFHYGRRVVVVPPALLKIYALGKGGGKGVSKTAVASAAAKRYGRVFTTDDEADAFVLAAMGADHLGHPLATVPATHRRALDKVTWPEVM